MTGTVTTTAIKSGRGGRTVQPSDDFRAISIKRFDELAPAALRAAAEYAAGDSAAVPDELPAEVAESFALQDDETPAVISAYASGMARGKRLGAAEDPANVPRPSDEDDDPEDWREENFH